MKVNPNEISQRAQTFIKVAKFFKQGLPGDFQVSIDEQDKITAVFHGKNSNDIEFILAEVLAKFSVNKKILEVWKINFREIENFLRDENHLQAFTGDMDKIESIFIKLKAGLIGFAVKVKLDNHQEWSISQRRKGISQSLTAQNEWAQILIRPLGWELVLCEKSILTVTNTPLGVDDETLTLLINTILSGEEIIAPMKVVAV